ncbi:hypothetical protein [Pseudomonas sp. TWP3-1]|uniref:hypothetical protein n=1 Tax=Pseudomonas sp. TWP3-1 TaxID=2804631 RepID=UPI003CED1D88
MHRLIIPLACLLTSAQTHANENHTEQARQTLKNYGLSQCILAPFPEPSELKKDISLSAGAYSFMGKGMHTVLQNEDTLQDLHDPYGQTRAYVLAAYEQTHSASKYSNQKVVFHACLEVYNSKAFDSFIKTQDPYISK